jgi:hypothetical protein
VVRDKYHTNLYIIPALVKLMGKLMLIFVFSFFALVSFVAAEPNITVEKINKGNVVIAELDNPAIFEFIINNSGEPEEIKIYSLVSVGMVPKRWFELKSGETIIEVEARPFKEVRETRNGFFSFEYQIKGKSSGILRDYLTVEIISLEDVLEIEPQAFYPGDSNAVITIRNKENAHIDDLEIEFNSLFFEGKRAVSLKPYEEVNVSLDVDSSQLKKVVAGPYIVNARANANGKEVRFEGILDYMEKKGLSVNERVEGFIIRRKTIEKTNDGNTPITARVELKKDIISRLFTINSPVPQSVEREGFFVTYVWERQISPEETFIVESVTNYTFPFIVIVLIIFIGFMVKISSQTAITLKKNVSLVRTKGGELALKVNLRVKALKHVDKIQIIDSLPAMTKIYEKFGRKPDRIDEKTKRLFWNIERLNKGEERLFSYIIYSKLRVVGRFELPAATAVFEREGTMQEAWSNKAFFVSGFEKQSE